MSGTECYSSAFFTAWHSSSQQDRGIMHCIPLKKKRWCKFEACNLPKLELRDCLHKELFFLQFAPMFDSLSLTVSFAFVLWWQESDCRDLWGVGRAAPEASVRALSACTQLHSAHGHCSYCITSLHGATEKYMLKLTLKWPSPQKILGGEILLNLFSKGRSNLTTGS